MFDCSGAETMTRLPLTVLFLTATAFAANDPADPVRAKLDKSKAAYTAEIEKFQKAALQNYDTLEALARKDGNKKLVDQIKADRHAFIQTAQPTKSLPLMLQKRHAAIVSAMEAAFGDAVKEYVRAKKDDLATAVEKEEAAFKRNRRFVLPAPLSAGRWKSVGDAIGSVRVVNGPATVTMSVAEFQAAINDKSNRLKMHVAYPEPNKAAMAALSALGRLQKVLADDSATDDEREDALRTARELAGKAAEVIINPPAKSGFRDLESAMTKAANSSK